MESYRDAEGTRDVLQIWALERGGGCHWGFHDA